jgi:hypothetical protein
MKTWIVLVVGLVSVTTVGCGQRRLRETPEGLLGLWRTRATAYADRFMEFRVDEIVLGTGGSTSATYPLRGFLPTDVEGVPGYIVYYETEGGDEYSMTITYNEQNGGTIRFPNQRNMAWRKVGVTIPPGA